MPENYKKCYFWWFIQNILMDGNSQQMHSQGVLLYYVFTYFPVVGVYYLWLQLWSDEMTQQACGGRYWMHLVSCFFLLEKIKDVMADQCGERQRPLMHFTVHFTSVSTSIDNTEPFSIKMIFQNERDIWSQTHSDTLTHAHSFKIIFTLRNAKHEKSHQLTFDKAGKCNLYVQSDKKSGPFQTSQWPHFTFPGLPPPTPCFNLFSRW